MSNLFDDIPDDLPQELFSELLKRENLRIERIVSCGHTSPESGWYDQNENEWVLVLKGYGVIEFDDGRLLTLDPGDHLDIPAHQRHRVRATKPDGVTIWLALFYW
jgi:cupin 2 domain-containing protein